MNDFVPRIDAIAPDRAAAVRVAPAAPAVAPVAASAQTADGTGIGTGANGGEEARREHMASAADYARVQARIADILARISTSMADPHVAQAEAEASIEQLRPEPTVIIPMLPASKEAVERAIELARSMAEQAALTRSAQSHVKAGTVDQILAFSA